MLKATGKWVTCCVAFALVASILSACTLGMIGGPSSVDISNPPPKEQYKTVDFKRWSSGLYADEYYGQWVVVEGYYMRNPYAFMQQGGSTLAGSAGPGITLYLTDQQSAPGSYATGQMPNLVVARASLSMRDQIYDIQAGQRVRVWGRVANRQTRNLFTGQVGMSTLLLEVQRIERL